MLEEQELIPYHTSDFPPSPWLIISPHPDDETIGMGGTIALATQKGIIVWVVVVTDGSVAGDPDERKAETCEAARILGIEKVIWWGVKDRQVEKSSVFDQELPGLLKRLQPATIFIPSPFEFHPDHRATTFHVLRCLKKLKYKGQVWLYEISRQGEANRLVDITKMVRIKKKALRVYRSQLAHRPYHHLVFSLNRARCYTLPEDVRYAEAFWDLGENYNLEELKTRYKSYWRNNLSSYPLVSIVVRTKNRPELLREALQSLADQTYPSVEAVVVNDGGTDVSEIVEEFTGSLYQVKYLAHNKNLGRAAAANTGLHAAEGDWVGFLDDDDMLLPDALNTLIEYGKATSVVYGQVEVVSFNHDGPPKTISLLGQKFSREALFINNYIPTCGLIFKRDLALKINGFDEGFTLLEDWDFIYRLAQETDFLFIPHKVAIYRVFGRGFIAEKDFRREAPWRERFYQKHLSHIDAPFLAKGFFDFMENQEKTIFILQQEFLKKLKLKDEKILSLKLKHEELLQALEEERCKGEKISQEIQAILSSESWRITAPLRWMGLKARNAKAIGKKLVILIRKFWHHTRTFGTWLVFKKTWTWIFARKTLSSYQYQTLTKDQANQILKGLSYKPQISVIVPVYNTPAPFLRTCLESVLAQYYPYWELCIADDASTEPHVREILEEFREGAPQKIKIIYRETNGHISQATNSALSLATGEFVAFLDHDDVLSPDALLELAALLNRHPEADLIYSDEDKIDEFGNHKLPFFKPDWSPDLLECQNYICHLLVVRKKVLERVGSLRKGFEGAQDYDLVLRITEYTEKIHHIPKILYSWREFSSSTSINMEAKPYARKNGHRALQEHLQRKLKSVSYLEGQVIDLGDLRYETFYRPKDKVLVSIIIPTKDRVDLLKNCIESILNKSTYRNFEIIIMNNNSEKKETYAYLEEISKKLNIRIIEANYEFNWSKINNHGIDEAKGEVFIFLNNDTEVITENWIEKLAGDALRPEVGVVGPLLLYKDGLIQHAGVGVGLGGWADELFKGAKPIHQASPFVSPMVKRNVLAVTGACMVIARKTINKIGNFDERFIVCGGDVEMCIRAYERGLYNIYNPFVRLYHYESKTRNRKKIPETDFRISYEVYRKYLKEGDPFYNPNLSLKSPIPSVNAYAQ